LPDVRDAARKARGGELNRRADAQNHAIECIQSRWRLHVGAQKKEWNGEKDDDDSDVPVPLERRHFSGLLKDAIGSADRDLLQELHVIERLAASENDCADRIVTHHYGEAGLFAKEHVEVREEGATTGEDDAFVDDVCCKLRGCLLERDEDSLDDRVDG